MADSTEEDGPLDPQLGRKFRNALVKAPPEVLATVRRGESLPVRSGKTTLWRQMVMAWATEGWTSAIFQSTEAMTNSTSAEITTDAMTLTMMLGSLHNDRTLLKEGLERGDIVTVEHPQQPGVLLYKHTLYRETAKQQAKTTLSLSKSGDTTAGATDEVVDNTVSWQFLKSSASGGSAGTGPLSLEDASETEKLSLSVQQAVQKCSHSCYTAKKILASATVNTVTAGPLKQLQETLDKAIALREHFEHWLFKGSLDSSLKRPGLTDSAAVRAALEDFMNDQETLNNACALLSHMTPKPKKG